MRLENKLRNSKLTKYFLNGSLSSWDIPRLEVVLGMHILKPSIDPQALRKRVKRVTRHKGFDSKTLASCRLPKICICLEFNYISLLFFLNSTPELKTGLTVQRYRNHHTGFASGVRTHHFAHLSTYDEFLHFIRWKRSRCCWMGISQRRYG